MLNLHIEHRVVNNVNLHLEHRVVTNVKPSHRTQSSKQC